MKYVYGIDVACRPSHIIGYIYIMRLHNEYL